MPPETGMLQAADLTAASGLYVASRTAGIVGVGTALPERRVSSSELAAGLGLADGWIERRTGIAERRYAGPGEGVTELAAAAGSDALEDAGVPAAEVDLVLVATLAPDDVTPSAAPLVAERLRAVNAGAIDIGAACAGAVSALALATSWIESGRARHVLVIGAEVISRFVDFEDRRTAHLFGDGAGALVLSAGAAGRVGPIVLGSDGSGAGLIYARAGEGKLRMEGHDIFLRAVEQLQACTRQVVAMAEMQISDVDLFVYHQANGRILATVADRLGVSRGRVVDCIAHTGNTSAASVPLALAKARSDGVLQPGMRIVLAAVGAGLTWAAAVVEWGA